MPARPGHSTLEPISKSYLIAAPTRGLLAEIGRGWPSLFQPKSPIFGDARSPKFAGVCQ